MMIGLILNVYVFLQVVQLSSLYSKHQVWEWRVAVVVFILGDLRSSTIFEFTLLMDELEDHAFDAGMLAYRDKEVLEELEFVSFRPDISQLR